MNKIIVVAHQKGGVGKSTISSNLASELSKKYTLNAIDLDLQKSLTYFNNVRRKANLKAFNIININSPAELKEVVNNNKDILIIDVGGYDSDINRLAIMASDVLITPVSDSEIEEVGLKAFKKILNDLRKKRPELTAKILFNRIHSRAGENNEGIAFINSYINDNPEFDKLNSILRDRIDYKRAWGLGQSVVEYNGKASGEMNKLINEVIEHAKN